MTTKRLCLHGRTEATFSYKDDTKISRTRCLECNEPVERTWRDEKHDLITENWSLREELNSLKKCYAITNESWKRLQKQLEIATKALEYINLSDSAISSSRKAHETLKQLKQI